MNTRTDQVLHHGGCHCGAVRFTVAAPARPTVLECTCSICRMSGFLHLIVPRSRFHLLRGQDKLGEYRFHTRTAQHRFCRICGIKSFYVPRSHPDGIDVNLRCLDPGTLSGYDIEVFDDVQREASTLRVAGLSRADDT